MKKQFTTFNSNLRLSNQQDKDAKTKYRGVCKTLHNHYYEADYDGSTKFLFGSYKKKTNIRPIVREQDVDVLFYMSDSEFKKYDNYESNGQSALLQKIKDILDKTYTTTDTIKGWGKVVLVEFSENKHNVEVLPAWENEDGSFKIPNSENGGSWDTFDPREDIKIFQESNGNTNGLTATLARMMKSWKRNTASFTLKSFQIEQYVISFLDDEYDEYDELSTVSKKFFEFLLKQIDTKHKSHVETALSRAKKALEYEDNDKLDDASSEWKKVFGDLFPSYPTVATESQKDYTPNEEYIENMFDVDFSLGYRVAIKCDVLQDGFRKMPLFDLLQRFILKPSKKLEFSIINHNVPYPYRVFWKVRNFGEEAKYDLRGEIKEDEGKEMKTENTRYRGRHYVECYIIKDGICVAKDRIDIPISKEN